MILENGSSRDSNSKRSHNGFPVPSNLGATAKRDTLGAGPSNEPPPPTYEEAVSIVEASASAPAPSSQSIARLGSSSTCMPTPASAMAPEKYAPQNRTSSPSPYANPVVTGYGAFSETNGGRHPSTATYYAPSTSSGNSHAGSGLAPSSAASIHSSSSLPDDRGASIARSSFTSTTHTSSSDACRGSYPSSYSTRGTPPAAADVSSNPQSQSQPPLSARAQSFARAPASDLPYGPFPPATLHAYSDDLQADGFPLDPPTCACAPAPHPFVTHDVGERDWARFLDDVRGAGGLSPVHSLIAGAAPIAVRVGIIGGLLAGHALRAHMKSKRKSPVADVVDEWNRRFFHPRCMDVVLAQGTIAYTGSAKALPPDLAWRANESAKGKHVKAYEDTSDDDEDNGPRGMAAVDSVGRRMDLVGRQLDTTIAGGGKRGRIALSQDLRASAGERWRLVVAYRPPVL